MAEIKLKLTMFWTDYEDDKYSDQSVHERYLRQMRTLLKKYGLGMVTLPSQRSAKFTLPYKGVFKEYPECDAPKEAGKLRNLANQVYPGKESDRAGVVVIFCPFARIKLSYDEEPSRTGGITFGYNDTYTKWIATDGVKWPPFVIINTRHETPDHGTLLHEVGHSAGLPHYKKGGQKNIMTYGKSRSELVKDQVKTLRHAYFAGK